MNKLKIILVILFIGSIALGPTGVCEKYGVMNTQTGSSADAKPDMPKNLVATVASSTQINIIWTDASDNEDGFKVERKTGANGNYTEIANVNANINYYHDSGLTFGVTYYYRVRAYNKTGHSRYSNEAGATACILPPTNLIATVISSSQINLSWTDNSNEELGYKIERKIGSGGIWSEIITRTANTISYSDTGLTPITQYYYRVRTYNTSGDSAYSNEVSTATSAVDDYVWVANWNSNNVTRIKKSDSSTTTIEVGTAPFGVAVDSDYVWITTYFNNVTRIRKSNLTTTTIAVGTSPTGVAVDTNYVWVAIWSSNSVTRIKKSDLTTTTITVGTSPYGVAIDANYVWVANAGSNNVTRINKADLSTTTIEAGSGSFGIAIDSDYVWITNYWSSNVTRIQKSDLTTTTIDVGTSPTGVAIDTNYVWVANSNNCTRILKSDLTTTTIAVGTNPYGVAIDANYVWVANYNSNNCTRILKSDLTTTTIPVGNNPYSLGDMTGYAYNNYAHELVAWWKFDETSGVTATDSSGNGNDGTVHGATWQDGALNFDGNDDVTVTNSTSFDCQNITVQAWFRPTNNLGSGSGVSDIIARGNGPYIIINDNDDGKIEFGLYSDNGITFHKVKTITATWSANTWYYIAGTYDGTKLRIYVNGELQNEVAATFTRYAGNTNLYIGSASWQPEGFYFAGSIDDVKIYNYVRTAGDIQTEYNNSGVTYWTEKIANGAVGVPSKRYPSIVWDGTKMIMFGGIDYPNYYNDLWWYYPATNTWIQQIAQGAVGSPSARYNDVMVWDTVGQRMIMFGGEDASGFKNDLWWYYPVTNTWIQQFTSITPSVRGRHSMVWDTVGQRVIMFGGFDDPNYYNDLWWYYPVTNTWIQQFTVITPSARCNHAMVCDTTGQRVIMFGGCGGGNDELWWYYPVTNTWTQQTPTVSPSVRDSHAMVWDNIGQRVIMFGGYDTSGQKNDLWWYYPATNTWIQQIKQNAVGSPLARWYHSMVWDGIKAIMFGGREEASYKNDLWWYSP